MIIKKLNYLVLALWLLASCKVNRPYERPEVTTAGLYRGQTATDTTTLAQLSYPEIFPDTILQGLIREGIEQNLDLRVAYTRIQQSQAYYAQSRAAFLPTLDANAGVTASRLSEVQGFGIRTQLTQYQAGHLFRLGSRYLGTLKKQPPGKPGRFITNGSRGQGH